MAFASQYLSKQREMISHISGTPSERLRYIIVIPAFCEPNLNTALDSLWECDRPAFDTEVIVVINSSENASDEIKQQNHNTRIKAAEWIEKHPDPRLIFHLIYCDHFPAKDAGVGLARKTGMDEALYRFGLIGQPSGYILSFDADCRCDRNYLSAIEQALQIASPHGFNVYFEHPVCGSEFSERNYEGIMDYEIHLRYVNQFLRTCGFPFAFHTVGSCFGVRADIYAQQGGMNKKKAGEDFYFLHKIIPLGNFIDIGTTRVIPSPRASSRVPFGTGVAIGKFLRGSSRITTYHPQIFLSLRPLFGNLVQFYKASPQTIESIIAEFPEVLKEFLKKNDVFQAIAEVNANCSSQHTFTIRFFRWFDAFRIVKYLNYASLNGYPGIPVCEAALELLTIKGSGLSETASGLDILEKLRALERKG